MRAQRHELLPHRRAVTDVDAQRFALGRGVGAEEQRERLERRLRLRRVRIAAARGEDRRDGTLRRVHDHGMRLVHGQIHPAARADVRRAIVGEPGNLEADFVHVGDEEQRLSAGLAERHRDVAALVDDRLRPRRQAGENLFAHRLLVTRDAIRLDERAERCQRIVWFDASGCRRARRRLAGRRGCRVGTRGVGIRSERRQINRGNKQRGQRVDVTSVDGFNRRVGKQHGQRHDVLFDLLPLVVQPELPLRYR